MTDVNCPRCYGSKKAYTLGNVMSECPKCVGTGKVKQSVIDDDRKAFLDMRDQLNGDFNPGSKANDELYKVVDSLAVLDIINHESVTTVPVVKKDIDQAQASLKKVFAKKHSSK